MTDDPMHPGQEPQHLQQAARCGAKTRSGTPCRSPAVTGRRRCRMHGGAHGSGGPKGARNGNYKHGRYTADTIATRRWLREQIREVRASTKRLRQLARGLTRIIHQT
jgi:glucans biosynthesis protein